VTETYSDARILLIGAFDDAMHAHTALRRRALQRLGCAVGTLNLTSPSRWWGRFRRVGLQERLEQAIAQSVPGIVLVLEGSQLEAAVVAELRRGTRALWLNWFCDGRRSLETVRRIAPTYDRVFVAGSEVVAALEEPGQPPARYLAPACDPSVHRPMRSRDQFRANVVFAGTATPHRERLLSELVEFGLALWGPGWRKTKLRDYCRGELLDHLDYVRAYAGASVALNLQWGESSGPAVDPGCNRRLFELAAIGVPQVAEDRPDLHRHFQEGSEVLVCRGIADFKALITEALHDRGWAEQVAAGARQRALTEHTYMHRMAELLTAVSSKQ
jgi:spore maturation protein CgeB